MESHGGPSVGSEVARKGTAGSGSVFQGVVRAERPAWCGKIRYAGSIPGMDVSAVVMQVMACHGTDA